MKKVVIVGVGALGSHVLQFARNWAVSLTVVDFDRIETKNLLAQFHTKLGSGLNKTTAIVKALQGLWGVTVVAVPHKLTRDNAANLLAEAALVLDCVDNAEARRVIQEYVRAKGVPCLHGGLSADGSFGRILWDEDFVADEEGAPGQATCEDGRALPFFALAGAQMALTAQLFLEKGIKQGFQILPSGIMKIR